MLPTIRSIARAVARGFQQHRVTGLAAEIAFFGVLGMFPTFLALAAALGSLEAIAGGDVATRAQDEVVSFLERVLSDGARDTIDAVNRLFEETNAGVLTIGTAAALWSASRGFTSVIHGLDVVYGAEERRSYPRLRGLAIALAVGTVVVLAVILAVVVLGPLLGTGHDVAEAIGLGSAFAAFWDWMRWPAALVLMTLWATTVLHVGPNHRSAWRDDLPGAVLTTAGWTLVSVGFRGYLAIAGGGNQVLGALGGALIVLLWMYALALALLVGAELNASLAARRAPNRPSTDVATLVGEEAEPGGGHGDEREDGQRDDGG
ncbi:MAG TPA: YihY/virulence factor BrkB family protein [Acidimicrobiales bacterium]|jgi:membrane protein|nr:YihY/virulence factor BrkB family protein [Acidimicrobiales bacterium]